MKVQKLKVFTGRTQERRFYNCLIPQTFPAGLNFYTINRHSGKILAAIENRSAESPSQLSLSPRC